MNEQTQIVDAAHAFATAIARQDTQALGELLAPGFLLRTPGGPTISAKEFIASTRAISVEIVFVRLEQLQVDLSETGALVTAIQHARIVDGDTYDEQRPFAALFVKNRAGRWQVRLALDLPETPQAEDAA